MLYIYCFTQCLSLSLITHKLKFERSNFYFQKNLLAILPSYSSIRSYSSETNAQIQTFLYLLKSNKENAFQILQSWLKSPNIFFSKCAILITHFTIHILRTYVNLFEKDKEKNTENRVSEFQVAWILSPKKSEVWWLMYRSKTIHTDKLSSLSR